MIIAGPAYIVKKTGSNTTATFKSETDITVTLTKETKERKASHLGKFDEILLSVKAEIKFKPVEWDNLDALFPWPKMKLGQTLFGDDEYDTKIYSADGQCYEFHKTAVTASPAIGCGVEKDLLGECTITALISKNKKFSDTDALYARTPATFNPPALVESKIFSIPFKVSYGATEVETEDGVDIDLQASTSERKKDDVGLYDYLFTGLEVTAKFKPINCTEAEYEALARPQGGVNRGRSLRAISSDLSIYGEAAGDPKFTIAKAVNAGSQTLTFGVEVARFGELEFRATSTQYEVPKFSIGSVEADDPDAESQDQG